jgi:hypothetical protein
MLFGLAGCLGAYFGYSVALGSIDGLPGLPPRFLEEATDQTMVINPPVSPTYARLADAFGSESNEVIDSNKIYKNRFEIRDKGLVFAIGEPIFDNTEMAVVSPVSVAMFGKASVPAKPGEVPEISTFHADKALLRFDRKIATLQDFHEGKAKLKGIELVPDPDSESKDPRRGQIWMTNNQKSKSENDKIVIRTAGRVFYQVPDENVAYNPDVAHIWTADPVEVVDRKNLPLTMLYEHNVARAALARPDDLRRRGAIQGILLDNERPPPTVTAIGMQIFLKPDEKKPGEKKAPTGSGVREIVLQQKVQMNLWSDGNSGMPGSEKPPPEKGTTEKKAMGPPSMQLIGLMGVAVGGATIAEQYEKKSLILVETPGSFHYDFDKSVAKFDVAIIPPPGGQPNLVSVTRMNAQGGQDNLFCKVLTLQFNKPDAAKPGAKTLENDREGGLVLRTMTATGQEVYVSIESDNLVAQGTELKYDNFPETNRSVTTLKGTPVIADREGSRMQAGDKLNPGEVVIDTVEPKPGSKGERLSTLLVKGAGGIEVHDQEQGKITAKASWGKQLRHEKVLVGDKYQDLLKFEGGGTFADQDGDFRLSADKIWLWLKNNPSAAPKAANAKNSSTTGTTPERLEADGNVDGRSPEMIIRHTDKLFVAFKDIPPPKTLEVAPKPLVVGKEPPLVQVPPVAPKPPMPDPPKTAKVAELEKETANPIYLSASVIRTRVNRYPIEPVVSKVVPKPGERKGPASGSLKYELENALCEERVEVEQAPDPKNETKSPLGLKIRGKKLNLDQSAAGSAMTVYGSDTAPAEVHFETTSIYGPQVDIDQPNNTVKVLGRGKLRMLSGGDLNGNDLSTPSDLEITWAKEMKFDGAKSYAEFIQNVTATQISRPDVVVNGGKIERPGVPMAAEVLPAPKNLGEPNQHTTRSTLQSFRLDITFDRPVYFNQLREERGAKPKDGKEKTNPKLRTAICTPIPEDERAQYAGTPPRDVYFVEEVFDNAAKYVRARRLRAKQLVFDNNEKEKKQELTATGEGELRLLQFDGNDEEPAKPMNPKPMDTKPMVTTAKPEEPKMKLTLVTFGTSMRAKEVGKLYQEANFVDGANVVQVPTTDLNLEIQLHALPKESLRLACRDLLTVSSSKIKPEAPAQQRLTAVGNAEFWNDKYQGNGGKITYEGSKVILDGTPTRLASLYSRERSPNQTNFHQAEQIIYHKDGLIEVKKSAGGSITGGGK